MRPMRQRIRFVSTEDGTSLAWADVGTGPVLVSASNWLTHLEYDWQSPVWRHGTRFFADRFRYIRYHERGFGMTDLIVGELSFERWVEDLEDVVNAVRNREPFDHMVLFGISQGAATAIAYAVAHPERGSAGTSPIPHSVRNSPPGSSPRVRNARLNGSTISAYTPPRWRSPTDS